MNRVKYYNQNYNYFLSIGLCLGILYISPLLFILLLPLWMRNLKPYVCCLITGIVFAIAAYYFEPDPSMDLAKYYKLLDKDVSILDYYTGISGDVEKADAFILLIFLFIKSLGLHSHYLAAISAFIHFSLITFISILWSQTLKNKKLVFPIFIGLIFSNYLLGFTGIRFENAILCMCISTIYLSNDKYAKSICWLIIGCIFHFGVLGIGLVILFSMSLSKRKSMVIMWFLLFFGIFFSSLLNIMGPILIKFGPIGASISNSIAAYTDTSNPSVLYAGSRLWVLQKFLSFSFLFFIVCSLLLYSNYWEIIKHTRLPVFTILLFGFQCLVFKNPQLFMRSMSFTNKYIFLLAIYIFCLSSKTISNTRVLNNYTKTYLALFFLIGIAASISGRELMQLLFIPQLI